MQIDLDRTQEWLNRTQSFPRTPPVRGGVNVDRKARRQTAFGVIIVLAAIVLLALFPRPDRTIPSVVAPEGQLDNAGARDLLSITIPGSRDVLRSKSRTASSGELAPSARGYLYSTYSGPYLNDSPLDTGIVAPPAPVWLVTLPNEWNHMSVPNSSPSNSVLNSAGALIER